MNLIKMEKNRGSLKLVSRPEGRQVEKDKLYALGRGREKLTNTDVDVLSNRQVER